MARIVVAFTIDGSADELRNEIEQSRGKTDGWFDSKGRFLVDAAYVRADEDDSFVQFDEIVEITDEKP